MTQARDQSNSAVAEAASQFRGVLRNEVLSHEHATEGGDFFDRHKFPPAL
jgi:hypothetical protein